jgi:hypothetical protein
MQFEFMRFALIGALTVTLCAAVSGAQKDSKANKNPPASPQAKTPQPAVHFTQGTITSIEANRLVIARTARGKTEQVTFVMSSQTQRSGNLVAGARVSVQYREDSTQKTAAAVRESPAKETVKAGKTYEPRPKS